MRWAGHLARMGEIKVAYSALLRKPEGKRLLERPRSRWDVNIKMDLQEVGCGDMDWIELALAGTSDCGNEPSVSIKCGEFLD